MVDRYSANRRSRAAASLTHSREPYATDISKFANDSFVKPGAFRSQEHYSHSDAARKKSLVKRTTARSLFVVRSTERDKTNQIRLIIDFTKACQNQQVEAGKMLVRDGAVNNWRPLMRDLSRPCSLQCIAADCRDNLTIAVQLSC